MKVEGGDDRGCGIDGCMDALGLGDAEGTGDVVGRGVGLGNAVGIWVNVGIGVMVGTGAGLDPLLELLVQNDAVNKELTPKISKMIRTTPILRAKSFLRNLVLLSLNAFCFS